MLIAFFVLLTGAPAASAHAQLVGSSPQDGSSVSTAPRVVTLEFNEAVDPAFVEFTVLGPDRSSRWENGSAVASGSTVTAGLRPLGPSGTYLIKYRVLSADGHPVSGTVRFRMSTEGAGVPSTASARPALARAQAQRPASDDSMPRWPWIAGIGALVVVGGAVAYFVARDPKRS